MLVLMGCGENSYRKSRAALGPELSAFVSRDAARTG